MVLRLAFINHPNWVRSDTGCTYVCQLLGDPNMNGVLLVPPPPKGKAHPLGLVSCGLARKVRWLPRGYPQVTCRVLSQAHPPGTSFYCGPKSLRLSARQDRSYLDPKEPPIKRQSTNHNFGGQLSTFKGILRALRVQLGDLLCPVLTL